MRTTLDLDEALIKKAARFTGIKTKTALIEEALRRMIRIESGKRLAALGGTAPDIKEIPRRKGPA